MKSYSNTNNTGKALPSVVSAVMYKSQILRQFIMTWEGPCLSDMCTVQLLVHVTFAGCGCCSATVGESRPEFHEMELECC